MNQEFLLKKRINALFGILCLPVAFQLLMASLLPSLAQFSLPEYFLNFVLPQFLYPVFNLLLALAALRFLRLPPSRALPLRRPKAEFFPWLGLFLGAVTAGNYLTEGMLALLERCGLSLPDVFSDYNPGNGGEAMMFFAVIVLLPALSEEILFRGMVGSGLREFHPGLAVGLSAFAFGMMHATVQQIPFAVALGVVLGLVYVRTGNLLYPILLHFINNSWACAVTFFQIFAGAQAAATVRFVGDVLFLFFGVASALWLWRKRAYSLKDLPRCLSGKQAAEAVLSSVGFWGFTALFLLLTVANALI